MLQLAVRGDSRFDKPTSVSAFLCKIAGMIHDARWHDVIGQLWKRPLNVPAKTEKKKQAGNWRRPRLPSICKRSSYLVTISCCRMPQLTNSVQPVLGPLLILVALVRGCLLLGMAWYYRVQHCSTAAAMS